MGKRHLIRFQQGCLEIDVFVDEDGQVVFPYGAFSGKLYIKSDGTLQFDFSKPFKVMVRDSEDLEWEKR